MEFFSPDQCTIRNLLIENGQLIETAAEYQRMGKIEVNILNLILLNSYLLIGSHQISEIASPKFDAGGDHGRSTIFSPNDAGKIKTLIEK